MSYYEDFGLPPDASPEQIRDAYRILVRLLHPDQQTDPALKRAAEGQMRRINRGYSVLADPEKRRQYDLDLQASQERSAPVVIRTPNAVLVRTQLQMAPLVWLGAAILSMGAIFWLATQGQSPKAQAGAPEATSGAGVPAASPQEPRPLPNPPTYKTAATKSPLAAAPEPLLLSEPQPLIPPKPLDPPTFAAPQLPAPTAPGGEPPHVVQNRFAGFWAYPRDKSFQRQSGQYPPQFIEASISEQDGAIHGKYRARYYVSDRPISPNVIFEFEGKPEGGVAKLPWRGEGGSQGQLEIKLLSAEEMELIWRATDFGQNLGLASGTAVLMRRPD